MARKSKTKKHATASIEEKIEESKFFIPPTPVKQAQKKDFDFPHSYGDSKIVLLVRDPLWIFAYWEIQA